MSMTNVDMRGVLIRLAALRPVFHSEADFQHNLAWLLHKEIPEAEILLEYPLSGKINGAIDILMYVGEESFAIELKYLCNRLQLKHGRHSFDLRRQGAQDIRRYDVMKDIQRMERAVNEGLATQAAVVVLSNDASYWKGPSNIESGSYAFSIMDGREVTGMLDWASHIGPGTRRARESTIKLANAYKCAWQDYSMDGKFRSLTISVPPRPVAM